ncbi:MAG: site-specific integrase [Bacteroidales bacterium]|nr:site-specific integrase [Bacteroidales bacterium]
MSGKKIKQAVSQQKSQKHQVAFEERGSWYCRFKKIDEYGNIKYGKKGGFKTQEDAENAYWSYQNAFQAQYNKINFVIDDNITFKKYLDYWFENIYAPRVKKTSVSIAIHALNHLIYPNVDDNTKLCNVTVLYLDDILEKCAKKGDSVAEECRSILSIAFSDAISFDYLKTNPLLLTKRYTREKKPFIIFHKEEIKQLLEEAVYSEWYLEILLGLFCGLRKGEIYGLKFSDFDEDNCTLKIQRQIVWEPHYPNDDYTQKPTQIAVERAPKTDAGTRKIRLHHVIVEEIKIRKRRIISDKEKLKERYSDSDYICCRHDGTPYRSARFNNVLEDICYKAGLPRITVHTLRHTFATIALESGLTLSKVSAMLGHSSIDTTFRLYCDISDELRYITAYINNEFVPENSDD